MCHGLRKVCSDSRIAQSLEKLKEPNSLELLVASAGVHLVAKRSEALTGHSDFEHCKEFLEVDTLFLYPPCAPLVSKSGTTMRGTSLGVALRHLHW